MSLPAKPKATLETYVERVLFASRWLLVPFYLGMVLALVAVMIVFLHELWAQLRPIAAMDAEQVILFALSLIDLSLTANLLLIVMFAGYENFVSRLDAADHEDRPRWMGAIDFSGLKLKLMASIAAISAIALLRAFLPLGEESSHLDEGRLRWMVAIHLTFVVSGILLAAMDWSIARSGKHLD